MDEKKKKNTELNIAIVLSIILLASLLFIFTRYGKEKAAPPPPSGEKRVIKKRAFRKRPIISEDEIFTEEDAPILEELAEEELEEEIAAIMHLKDLPLNELSPEEIQAIEEGMGDKESLELDAEGETTIGSSFKTHPSLEDMKAIQKKGAIIY